METPSTNTTPIPSHGKNSKRKESRPTSSKALKRASLLGDSFNSRGIPSTTARARDKEAMAASFLQYCAMCEKQIMTPSNSLLYCSEACRRKDSAKPLSATILARPASVSGPSPPRPMLHMRPSSFSMASHSSAPVLPRIPPDMHGHKSDLDPTEWKPKLGDKHRNTSEAFRYLSQFHQNMNMNMNMNNASMMTIPNPPSDTPNETPDGLVANVHYNNTGAAISTTRSSSVTSLNNTPTTGPSSLDSNMYAHIHSYNYNPNHNPSKEHDYYDHEHEHDQGSQGYGDRYDYDYDFNLRPLPPRQNPLYYSTSVGAGPGRGIELVTPHVAPPSLSPSTVSLSMTGETLVSSVPIYDHDFWGTKKDKETGKKNKVIGSGNAVGGGGLFGKAA